MEEMEPNMIKSIKKIFYSEQVNNLLRIFVKSSLMPRIY